MEESKMDYKQLTGKIKLFLFKDDDTIVISIKFRLVISVLCKTVVVRITDLITQDEFA